MTQSPDAGEMITHQRDCILSGMCRLSSLHALGLPNSGPAIDNTEDEGRIPRRLKSNQKMQINMFWEPKCESRAHFPLPSSSTSQPSQKQRPTYMLVGPCLWGPGCCCWKPWQSPHPTSPLLLPESLTLAQDLAVPSSPCLGELCVSFPSSC